GFVGAAHADVKHHVWVLCMKTMQNWRNETLNRRLKTIDVDRAGLDILYRCDMRLNARESAHLPLDLLPQNEARRRERHPFGTTVEDGRAKLMLEFRNLPANRRCRNVKPFGGGPDRTRMRGLAEIAQRREIHGRLPALHLRQRNGAAIDMASTYVSNQC